MQIKEPTGRSGFAAQLFRVLKNHKVIVGAVLLVLYTGTIFYLGALAQMTEAVVTIKNALLSNYRIALRYVDGLTADPERLTIDIAYKNSRRLAYLRQRALASGRIITSADSYVPARIRVGDKTVRVDLRLKGDVVDHIEGDKWSLRVKVKGNDSVFGMQRFSLQNPEVSGVLNEWMLHKLYAYEGLIALRFKFVAVTINGKNKGIYALEESFSKELVENNKRREGPLLKFDESYLHTGALANAGTAKSQADVFFSSRIDSFRTKQVMSDSTLRANFEAGRRLLEDLRAGKLPPAEVFDVKRLATLYALTNLTSSDHALRWKNIRFYYNPITNTIEAIGYNAYGTRWDLMKRTGIIGMPGYLNPNYVWEFHNLFFRDRQFLVLYMKELDRISRKEYLDRFLASIQDELEHNLSIIHSEQPIYFFKTDTLYANQELIRGMLNPAISPLAKIRIADASGSGQGRKVGLLVANPGFLPIQMVSLEIVDTSLSYLLEPGPIPGKTPSAPLEYHEVRLRDTSGIGPAINFSKGIKLTYHLQGLGFDRLLTTTVDNPQVDSQDTRFMSTEGWKPALSTNPMLEVDLKQHTITIKPGRWIISENLVIPAGHKLLCPPGVTLDLRGSGRILSYSPLAFAGTEAKPIVVRSTDSTGQGVAVLDAAERSVLKYVTFENLSNPSQGGWSLTGAVTFYQSPVTLSHCTFSGSRCEDGLNIVRSEYEIDSSVFKDARSDALDADFCDGRIISSSFINSGNDAIDVSGGKVTVTRLRIDGAGDKGLSSGEKNVMTAEDVQIQNAEIAVAGKDMSKVTMKNIRMSQCKVGFAVFQKKSEFGPARVSATGVEMNGVDVPGCLKPGRA